MKPKQPTKFNKLLLRATSAVVVGTFLLNAVLADLSWAVAGSGLREIRAIEEATGIEDVHAAFDIPDELKIVIDTYLSSDKDFITMASTIAPTGEVLPAISMLPITHGLQSMAYDPSGVRTSSVIETTWEDCLKEGYDIRIIKESDIDSGGMELEAVLIRNGKEVSLSEIHFKIYPKIKLVLIEHFYPEFPNEKKGRGRALLRHLLDPKKYAGYHVVAQGNRKFRDSFAKMHDFQPLVSQNDYPLLITNPDLDDELIQFLMLHSECGHANMHGIVPPHRTSPMREQPGERRIAGVQKIKEWFDEHPAEDKFPLNFDRLKSDRPGMREFAQHFGIKAEDFKRKNRMQLVEAVYAVAGVPVFDLDAIPEDEASARMLDAFLKTFYPAWYIAHCLNLNKIHPGMSKRQFARITGMNRSTFAHHYSRALKIWRQPDEMRKREIANISSAFLKGDDGDSSSSPAESGKPDQRSDEEILEERLKAGMKLAESNVPRPHSDLDVLRKYLMEGEMEGGKVLDWERNISVAVLFEHNRICKTHYKFCLKVLEGQEEEKRFREKYPYYASYVFAILDYSKLNADDAPPIILYILPSGEYMILGGHKRVVAAKLRGDHNIKAIVLTRTSPMDDEVDIEKLRRDALKELEAFGDTYLELAAAMPVFSKYTLKPILIQRLQRTIVGIDYDSRNKALAELIQILPQIKKWIRLAECIASFLDVNHIHQTDDRQDLLTLIDELRSKTETGKRYLDLLARLDAKIQRSTPDTEPPTTEADDSTSPAENTSPINNAVRTCEKDLKYLERLTGA